MPFEGALRDRLGAGDGLIETLRYDPVAGPVRLERHLARLAASARTFAIPFDRKLAETALAAAAQGKQPLRVRLTLAKDGATAASSANFAALPAATCWRLAVASTRLDSLDPLLRHKTTLRSHYETARAEFLPAEADEVLMLNEHGEVCEGTITNVFVDNGSGVMLTPALACGLLPGILRGEMIDQGKAAEATLELADLHSARAIFVGNSLRGLIRCGLS
jgi:4-amino-4-deoxychorismate lyase